MSDENVRMEPEDVEQPEEMQLNGFQFVRTELFTRIIARIRGESQTYPANRFIPYQDGSGCTCDGIHRKQKKKNNPF